MSATKKQMTKTEELKKLADNIKRDLVSENRHVRDGLATRLKVGRDLLRAKELKPHGGFTQWCSENFDMSKSTGARYMSFAREEEAGIFDLEDITSMDEALKLIAAANREADQHPEPSEPREPANEAAPPASEADYEEEVEGEEYDFGSQEEYEEWNDEAQGGAAQEPEPSEPEKEPERKRDLLQSAFDAIHRALEEVGGEKRAERIRAIISRVKVYETTEVEPRQNRKKVTSKLRGRTVGTAADVVARLHPDGDAALEELAS